mgnify:FL=1
MPSSIKYFEWVFLGSLIIGSTVSILAYSTRAGISGNDALLYALTGIDLFLVILVSRRRSNIARWILVVMVVMGTPFYFSNLVIYLTMGLIGAMSSIQLVAQYGSICLLFTAGSRQWFER